MSGDSEWDEPLRARHPWRRFVVVSLVVLAILAGFVLPLLALI